jgi:hypothetical protein
MVLLIAKIEKKKSFLWNLLFHAFVNYCLRMHHFGWKWKKNSGGGARPLYPPPFYHVAASNFNSACSILSYWIPWYILCNLSKPNLLGASFCVLSKQVFCLNRAQLITTLVVSLLQKYTQKVITHNQTFWEKKFNMQDIGPAVCTQ